MQSRFDPDGFTKPTPYDGKGQKAKDLTGTAGGQRFKSARAYQYLPTGTHAAARWPKIRAAGSGYPLTISQSNFRVLRIGTMGLQNHISARAC